MVEDSKINGIFQKPYSDQNLTVSLCKSFERLEERLTVPDAITMAVIAHQTLHQLMLKKVENHVVHVILSVDPAVARARLKL